MKQLLKLKAKQFLFFTLCLFLAQSSLFAQQYPVRATSVLLPPYSLRLADYATTTEEKLQLQLLMTDLQEPIHNVTLRFWLETGTSYTTIAHSAPVVVGLLPISLSPGVPITLSNIDLRPLFELQNLSGINPKQYATALPQGLYRFCFQVFDVYTQRALSQKSCATVYLQQYDPPLLTLPQRGEIVFQQGEFQNLLFQWMPRQMAPNTKYTFTLKELWDLGQSPVSGFLSSIVLWEEETFAPVLHYGMDKPILIPGKRYAWQVRAKSSNPALPGYTVNPTDDNGVYANNGLSEIFYFDYSKPCLLPEFVLAKNMGRGKTQIRWSYSGVQPSVGYKIQYRKRNSTQEWNELTTYSKEAIIGNLQTAASYEYRVGTVCGTLTQFTADDVPADAYAYGKVHYFTTQSEEETTRNYQCGVLPDIDLSNKEPLQGNLAVNEVFMASDFPVTVLTSQGQGGTYSGEGYIEVPYLGDTKLKVVFRNIRLNTDKQLIGGVLETTYDASEKNVVSVSEGLGELFGDKGIKTQSYDYAISSVTYDEKLKKIIIKGNAGAGTNADAGSGEASVATLVIGRDYEIKDNTGKIWTVDEEGNVTEQELAEGGKTTPQNTDGVAGDGDKAEVKSYTAQDISVNWDATDSKYAFDDPMALPEAMRSAYPSVTDSKGTKLYESYKAVVNGQEDVLVANLKFAKREQEKDAKIVFKTTSGKAIEAKKESETRYRLQLKGAFSYAEEKVVAVLMPKEKEGKQQVIGSFRLVHLAPKSVRVKLVATDANSQSKLAKIQRETNAIYAKVGVHIDFDEDRKVYDISTYLNDSDAVLAAEDGRSHKKYNNVEKAINSGYANAPTDRYVLFVTSSNSGKAGLLGYMPLNGQFGYVYSRASQKTAAHELGHGVFKLEHYGDNDAGILMASSNEGTRLTHKDWKQINDPKFKLYTFSRRESGEYKNSELVQKIIQEIRCAYLTDNLNNTETINSFAKELDGWFSNKYQSIISLADNNVYICLEYDNKKTLDLRKDIIPQKGSYDKSEAQFLTKLFNLNPPRKFEYKYDLGSLKIYTLQGDFMSYLNPSKTRVQEDFRKVWTQLNLEDGLQAEEFNKIKSIAACATKHILLKDRIKLLTQLSKYKLTEDSEDLVLDILQTTPKGDREGILEFLAKELKVFEIFYKRIDNDSDNSHYRFLSTLYSFWQESSFASFTNSAYSYVDNESPKILGHKTKGKLLRGFSFPEIEFRFDTVAKKIYIRGVDSGDLDSQDTELYTYYYHPFQPIIVYDIEDNEKLVFNGKGRPAFFFMGMENIKQEEAVASAWSFIFDTSMLLTGVGELNALRKMTGVAKIARATILGTQISSATIRILLDYSKICEGNEKDCEAIREALFWVEIASFSADVFTQQMVRRSAKRALKGKNIPKNIKDELEVLAGAKKLADAVDDILDITKLKNIVSEIPTGNNLTNLKYTQFKYKVKPTSGDAKKWVDEVIQYGDNGANGVKAGDRTEKAVNALMENKGYTLLDGKYGSNNGYDAIYIKGTTQNPTEIIIIESKQFKYKNGKVDLEGGLKIEPQGANLGQPNANTGLPSQMSDEWVRYVAEKLEKAGKTDIADMILDNPGLIKKYVSAVDKVEGEINFLKLGNY